MLTAVAAIRRGGCRGEQSTARPLSRV